MGVILKIDACINTCMASKNINIEISVYEKLSRLKNTNESFSDLLTRLLTSSRSDPKESFGVLKNSKLEYTEIKKRRGERNVIL